MSPSPVNHYFGPGSTPERFLSAHGQVLRLGADLDTGTLTHHSEYCAQVPDKTLVTRRYVLAGGQVVDIESLGDTLGIRQWSEGDHFSQILVDYLDLGHARTHQVGECQAQLMDGPDFHTFAVAWLERCFGVKSSAEGLQSQDQVM